MLNTITRTLNYFLAQSRVAAESPSHNRKCIFFPCFHISTCRIPCTLARVSKLTLAGLRVYYKFTLVESRVYASRTHYECLYLFKNNPAPCLGKCVFLRDSGTAPALFWVKPRACTLWTACCISCCLNNFPQLISEPVFKSLLEC